MNGKQIFWREYQNGRPVIDSTLAVIRSNGVAEVMWYDFDTCVISGAI